MCLMSAPAAKKPSTADATIMTFRLASAASRAACRPSRTGSPSALTGGRFSVTTMSPGVSTCQLTTPAARVPVTMCSPFLGLFFST
jgi:hypothetical protein